MGTNDAEVDEEDNRRRPCYLRQSDEGHVEELGVAAGGGEGCRQGAQLGLGHRGAVPVVDVQHRHVSLGGDCQHLE